MSRFKHSLSIALIYNFSVIDIVGNIPVIIDLKKKGVEVDSMEGGFGFIRADGSLSLWW
ncbi:MAG: hypothetical protein IPO48_07045 [Saprospiraceae bacterium]|nr:hypothetical protein [Saprospiraceae bacterium]